MYLEQGWCKLELEWLHPYKNNSDVEQAHKKIQTVASKPKTLQCKWDVQDELLTGPSTKLKTSETKSIEAHFWQQIKKGQSLGLSKGVSSFFIHNYVTNRRSTALSQTMSQYGSNESTG